MTIEDLFSTPETGPEDVKIDPAEDAASELATAMVLAPEDLLDDVGPLAQLLFLQRTAWHVLRGWTGMLAVADPADVTDDSEPVKAHQALALAVGEIDAAAALVALIPPEQADGPSA